MNNAIVEALGLRHDELREEIRNHINNADTAQALTNEQRREMTEQKKFQGQAEAKLADVKLVMERMGETFINDVWTNVDLVYETRWDCRPGQLEAA